MITLNVLAVLYTIFGFMKFKKRYGHYSLVDEDMKGWTLLLAICAIFSCMGAMLLIIKYLP
jgi:hypothetical protein